MINLHYKNHDLQIIIDFDLICSKCHIKFYYSIGHYLYKICKRDDGSTYIDSRRCELNCEEELIKNILE